MRTKDNFEIGSFVVVRGQEDESDAPMWIDKVLPTILDESENVSKLRIDRFDMCFAKKRLSGRNLASFHRDGDVKAHAAAWTDEISTDAVMVTFPKLKVNGRIPNSNLKRINRDRHSDNGKQTESVILSL